MSSLTFLIYRYLLAPYAYVVLQAIRPVVRGKLREMIEDKNQGFCKIQERTSQEGIALAKPFWIHAASGEIEYARPVIRELKRLHPEVPILVTYSSPSAKKILSSIHEIDAWTALPWDLEWQIQAFIQKWNPRALLFARTDVWPVLAVVAHRNNIPSSLFSATFADNSSRLKGLSRHLTEYALNQLSEIQCVSEEDVQNLKSLSLKTPVKVSGDTRFDQVFHRLENPKPLKNQLIPSPDDFIFIAGSTWSDDELVLLPALEKLKDLGMRVILAPHEVKPTHLEHLQKQMDALKLPFVRYSDAQTWPAGSILLVDQVGILAELYTWADVAFIGGSFKKQVHSVMEALAAGLPVLVGPHHRNNREALFYQKKNFSSGMIVQVVHSPADITVLLQRMKKQQSRLPQIKEEIRTEIGKNRNSTQRVVSALFGHLLLK